MPQRSEGMGKSALKAKGINGRFYDDDNANNDDVPSGSVYDAPGADDGGAGGGGGATNGPYGVALNQVAADDGLDLSDDARAARREKLANRHVYSRECCDLAVFACFISLFSAHLFLNHQGHTSYLINGALDQRLVGNEWFPKIDFMGTSNAEQYFSWLQNIFVPQMYPLNWYNGHELSEAEQHYMDDLVAVRLGSVRLRQLRVQKDTCDVAIAFENAFPRCYSEWTWRDEEGAHSYNGERYFDADANKVGEMIDMPAWYSIETGTWYSGSGTAVYLSDNGTVAREQVERLREDTWIDARTRLVSVEFTLYVPSVDLLVASQMVIEMPPTGDVIPVAQFYPTQIHRTYAALLEGDAPTGAAAADAYLEVLLYVVAAALILHEVQRAKSFPGGWRVYWTSSANVIELLNLCLFGLSALLRFTALTREYSGAGVRDTIERAVAQLDPATAAAAAAYRHDSTLDQTLWYKGHDVFVNLFPIRWYIDGASQINAFNALFTYVKFFKYVRFHAKLLVFVDTFTLAFRRMTTVCVVLLVIGLGYGCAFHLTFGYAAEDYKTMGSSIYALGKVALGDFELGQIRFLATYMGPFLLFSFIVLVIMVVLSMFFAIVGEAYGECMEKAKTGETFWDSPIAKDFIHLAAIGIRVGRNVPGLSKCLPLTTDEASLRAEADKVKAELERERRRAAGEEDPEEARARREAEREQERREAEEAARVKAALLAAAKAAAAPSYAAANPKLLLVTELLTLEEQQRELLGSIEAVTKKVRDRAMETGVHVPRGPRKNVFYDDE